MEIEGEVFPIYVVKRPGVKEFLEKMKGLYEIVIFTASLSLYADPLLDMIDSLGSASYRLFRDHCTLYNNTFVKDLSILGRDLKNVIIVDNSPTAYLFQPENAIPIVTWIDDMKDTKLFELAAALELMARVEDVREVIRATVRNDSLDFLKLADYLRNELGSQAALCLNAKHGHENEIHMHRASSSESKKSLGKKDGTLLKKAMKKGTPDSAEETWQRRQTSSKRRKKCGTPTPYSGKLSLAGKHGLRLNGKMLALRKAYCRLTPSSNHPKSAVAKKGSVEVSHSNG